MTNGQYYPIRNLQFTNNKIIAGLADGNSIQFMIFGISSFDDIALWGLATSSGNIYARPLAVSTVDKDFYYNSGLSHDWAWRTHAWWASATGDNNSTFSSVSTSSVNNIHFIYNATKTNKTFTLSQSMVDIANVSYSGTITVTPYTSKVLVGAGTVIESTGGLTAPSITTTVATNITNNGALFGGNVTSNGGDNNAYAGVLIADWVHPTLTVTQIATYSYYPAQQTNPFTISISGLLNPLTTYYYRAYIVNSIDTAYGAEYSIKTLGYPQVMYYKSNGKFVKSNGKFNITH